MTVTKMRGQAAYQAWHLEWYHGIFMALVSYFRDGGLFYFDNRRNYNDS